MPLGRTLLLKFYYFCSVLQFVGQPTKTLRTVITFFSKCYIFLTRAVLNKKKKQKREKEKTHPISLIAIINSLTVLTIKENSIIDF